MPNRAYRRTGQVLGQSGIGRPAQCRHCRLLGNFFSINLLRCRPGRFPADQGVEHLNVVLPDAERSRVHCHWGRRKCADRMAIHWRSCDGLAVCQRMAPKDNTRQVQWSDPLAKYPAGFTQKLKLSGAAARPILSNPRRIRQSTLHSTGVYPAISGVSAP
jgi:hypothetical protein